MRLPIARALTKGTGDDGTGDAASKRRRRVRVVFCGAVAQRAHQLGAWIRVVFLGRRHLCKRRLKRRPTARAAAPGFSQLHQIPPLIAARVKPWKKFIDPTRMARCARHWRISSAGCALSSYRHEKSPIVLLAWKSQTDLRQIKKLRMFMPVDFFMPIDFACCRYLSLLLHPRT